jgi:chromosome segregation ATPase
VLPAAVRSPGPPTRPAAEQVEALQTELARVRDELREARGRLEAAVPRAAQEAALRQMAGELDAEKRKMIAEMSGRIAGLNHALEQRSEELERMKHALAGISGKLTAARADAGEARKQADKARRSRDADDDEAARLRRMHDEALAAARDARRQLAALKTKHEALLGDLQRLYVAAAAGGEVDLAARQAAARRARIAARCAEARAAARTPLSRRLLEQLEVAFTRLDLLDAADAAEASAFASLVRRGALASRIDGLLAAADEAPQVRSLLLEAKLILWGADRVG